jgi:diadenosine tetraphosphate (Ap4A) HIT family hydrolase
MEYDGKNRAQELLDDCPHCLRIRRAKVGVSEGLVYETQRSLVVAGDHQFFPGYCVVVAKRHIREMHELPDQDASALFLDVLHVGRVLQAGFRCLKMNYVSLGNVHEHLHWHVIPRYQSDPDHKDHPWKNSHLFSKYPTSVQSIATIKELFEGPKNK